jgi:hypothetical protein
VAVRHQRLDILQYHRERKNTSGRHAAGRRKHSRGGTEQFNTLKKRAWHQRWARSNAPPPHPPARNKSLRASYFPVSRVLITRSGVRRGWFDAPARKHRLQCGLPSRVGVYVVSSILGSAGGDIGAAIQSWYENYATSACQYTFDFDWILNNTEWIPRILTAFRCCIRRKGKLDS